ncbi:alpha-ketoglutarate-dependent dioxygenase AlkB [Sphingopyxis sp. RIFCSPHIGHO2_12_FULL_65_19]|uniref:alpha-ketoglutarate-dependent dioxygenase AlkB n=1 Tax=Sphingopyxis sp. RIFCSPHIGHO2_12_FULL_65_19 TaxID=1802172 RepID=UPI0008B5141C|nr:alpha-ketoglutarate-dependent dioxygenase AlkB [Sphingopyxis sp. RIFCSPHIGHO2_12_FULL_65_19]OHD08725.1 MAG: 2OG-Fe(II) oxygenase [Sphingopyxis sp. RIFCSPHIGHO2_12_FULL_65_19]
MKHGPVSKSAAAQADLFGRALLPGVEAAEAFVTEAEEAALIAHIEHAGLEAFKFQQWEGKRLTRSFGWSYDFQTGAFARAAPIPDWLLPMAARAERFADLPPGALAQALLISYGPGAGIGWHKDRPVFEHVVGISLGAEAAMRFRRRRGDKFDRFSLPLAPRSIYRLAGEARHAWEHSIAPIEEARWSITFRSLAS